MYLKENIFGAKGKCKKLSFIARKGLKYDRVPREYFKGCECNKGIFYTYVLQHFIYDCEIIAQFQHKFE
jgi:hypothetical protein